MSPKGLTKMAMSFPRSASGESRCAKSRALTTGDSSDITQGFRRYCASSTVPSVLEPAVSGVPVWGSCTARPRTIRRLSISARTVVFLFLPEPAGTNNRRKTLITQLHIHPERFGFLYYQIRGSVDNSNAFLSHQLPMSTSADQKGPGKRPRAAGDDGRPGNRKAQRKRAALACDECRSRKRRCDGGIPACGGCARRLTTCVYSSEVEAGAWRTR